MPWGSAFLYIFFRNGKFLEDAVWVGVFVGKVAEGGSLVSEEWYESEPISCLEGLPALVVDPEPVLSGLFEEGQRSFPTCN